MSKFFIERPIFANVIAIITVLLGAVCLYNLPVAQYPRIVPPTIQVTTSYAGASAETVANTVGIPIEQNVNGVENSIYMQSTSGSDGTYTLTVTFAIGTDLNVAVALVAMLYSTYAIYASGVSAVLGGTLVMAVGFIIYGFIAPRFSSGATATSRA